MTLEDVIRTDPKNRIKMSAAAKLAGMALPSILRKVRQRKLTVVKAGRGWETTPEAVRAMMAAETEAALDKLGATPAAAPIRSPAAKSRSHAAAVKKLIASGVMTATADHK